MSDRRDSIILHSSSGNDSSGTDSDSEDEIRIRWITLSGNQMLTRVLSRRGSNKKDKDKISSTEQAISNDQSNRIRELRERLEEKEKLLYQLEQQEREFLGIDNQSQDTTMFRIEFKTTISKNHYLIQGCPETFIPAGESVIIFGQLQNKRWRCVVEDDYANNGIERSSKQSSDAFPDGKKSTRTCNVSQNIVQDKKGSGFVSCYPLIGSLPSSVIADFNDGVNLENDDRKALYSEEHYVDEDIKDTNTDKDYSNTVCECGRRLPSSRYVHPRLPSCSFCQYCTYPSPIQTITPEHLEQLNLQRFPSMSATQLPTLPESPTESTIAELNMALGSLAKLRPRLRPVSSESDGSCRNSWTYR